MSKEQESLKTEIYGLLKSRGFNPISKDSSGNTVPVPEEAEVFEFMFSKDGKDYGKVWVTLDGLKQLIIYYSKEVADSPKNGSQDSNSFSQLTNVLKRFATNRQLSFERSDQSNLEADMAKREHTKKQEQVNEGYYPIGRNASGNNNIPSVTMRIQHTRPIEEGEQRYRNIAKIFVENQDGERILLPTNKPGLARTYVRHIAEGGKPNDERWNHLTSLCEEYQKMAGFVRATRNGQFNESAQSLVNEGINHYQKLRETLSKLSGKRGYNEYFENYTPALMEDEEQVDLSEMFMSASLDPRIESVMPILSKLSRNITETKKDMEEVIALENWADEIITHKGGKVTHKDGVTKHQAGPDQYGGSLPDEEKLDRIKTSHINKMDKALGVKFDREKKMGGGIKVDEGPNDDNDDYVDPEEADYDSPEWQETERRAGEFMSGVKKREVAQRMHAILNKGKENEVDEGWAKNALAGAALVGAGALGGAAMQAHSADTHGHDVKKPTVSKVAPSKVQSQKDTSNYKLPSQDQIDKRLTGGYKLPSQDQIDKRLTGGYKFDPAKAELPPSTRRYNESVVNELSPGTLSNYVNKAVDDVSSRSHNTGIHKGAKIATKAFAGQNISSPSEKDSKIDKRKVGISKAISKLEEVDTGEYDARKSTSKGETTPEQEKDFRKKVQTYGKELDQRQKEKKEVKEGQEDLDAILRIIRK